MFLDLKTGEEKDFNQLIKVFDNINDLPLVLTDERKKQLLFEISLKIENEIRSLASISSSDINLASSRKRIEAYKQFKSKYLKKCKDLLGDKFNKFDSPNIPQSNFNLYPELFLRDWIWESSEISIFLNFLNQNNENEDEIIFLGCGAGRLAYETATSLPETKVYGTDLNPLNLLPLLQNNFKAYDAQLYPFDISKSGNKFDFKKIQLPSNLNYFISDFYELPIINSNCVVTTWLLDTLPNKFHELIAHIVYALNENASYYYIGLANFHKKSIEDMLSQDEIIDVLNNFFESVTYEVKFIPYMQDPNTSLKREELVLFAKCNEPKKELGQKIKNETRGIKYNQFIHNQKMEVQTFYKILKNINTDTSLEAIVSITQKEFGFSQEESLAYAKIICQRLSTE